MERILFKTLLVLSLAPVLHAKETQLSAALREFAAGQIDPVKNRYTIMMLQRSNFGNGDASDTRGLFQKAAARGSR